MIGSLIAILSLNLTSRLVAAGQVAGTLAVTGATVTAPINLTVPNHPLPSGRVMHAVVAGVTGTSEANGVWVLTYVDPETLSLSTFDGQGLAVPSVGAHAYTGGGTVEWAFPDFQVLLGQRMVNLASALATPRIVFVPTDGAAWNFEPYDMTGAPASLPPVLGNAEQQSAMLQPQIATEPLTFLVYVSGAANPPSPDFGDFDATQIVTHAMYAALFDMIGGRVKVLRAGWPSQAASAGTLSQRGQQWKGLVEIQSPVYHAPLTFVPHGTSLVLTVQPVDPGVTDPQTITIPGA